MAGGSDADLARPLLRFYDEVINEGNLDTLDDIYIVDYVNHAAPFGLSKDLAGLRDLMASFSEGFPDQRIVVDEIFVANDRVVSRWTLRGTHLGEFQGFAPTGRPIWFSGIDIERIVGDRIAEHWGAEDLYSLFNQIA